jgi:predicted hotdog family 3-hydroxylacyl-ACP dehydratase
MAVHGGLRARAGGGSARPGLLVALRGVALHCTRLDDLPGPLDCEATLLVDGDAGWQYAFRIFHQGSLLAEGRAAVMPDLQGEPG